MLLIASFSSSLPFCHGPRPAFPLRSSPRDVPLYIVGCASLKPPLVLHASYFSLIRLILLDRSLHFSSSLPFLHRFLFFIASFSSSLPFLHRFLFFIASFSICASPPLRFPSFGEKGWFGCVRVSWHVLHTRLLGAFGVLDSDT
jgi:hypothetical protein